jgi:hypothetical protein
MIKIEQIFVNNTEVLGTAVEIIVFLDTASPSTITISIEDSVNVDKVVDSSMSLVASKIYKYIYQSSITDNSGLYTAVIKVGNGTNTTYDTVNFNLFDNPLED